MNRLLSATEVSEYLGISKRSLESMLQRGAGPRYLWVGRQRRWAPLEVINWTRQQMDNEEKGGQPVTQ